jgi:arabinose-5-phosphate isomerase
MRTGARVPSCAPGDTVAHAMACVTRARGGLACLVEEGGRLTGIMTDGDFRRVVAADAGALSHPLAHHATRDPKRIGPDRLVAEAMGLMRDKKVNQLPVVDDEERVVGLLDIQDIVGLRLEV